MLDLTDVATRENWRNIVHPVSLLDSCTVDGKVYCAPVNIHSWQWIWLSHAVYRRVRESAYCCAVNSFMP